MSNRTTVWICTFVLALPQLTMGQEPKKGPPAKLAERIEYRFREGITKHRSLRLCGPDVKSIARIDARGLRLDIPVGRRNSDEVGVESSQRLRGDFEITMQYEFLTQPDPPPKLGAGAVLMILLDTPDQLRARLGRTRRADGSRFGANYITMKPDGKDDFKGIVAPMANDKQSNGHLRLVRTGSKLSYDVEEGGTGFRTITTKEVGKADVLWVKALCSTGWQPFALDVRFTRLELRSEEMPQKEADLAAPVVAPPMPQVDADDRVEQRNPLSGIRPVVYLAFGLGAVTLLALVAVLIVFLRRRNAEEAAKA